jgi:hypothetical protein
MVGGRLQSRKRLPCPYGASGCFISFLLVGRQRHRRGSTWRADRWIQTPSRAHMPNFAVRVGKPQEERGRKRVGTRLHVIENERYPRTNASGSTGRRNSSESARGSPEKLRFRAQRTVVSIFALRCRTASGGARPKFPGVARRAIGGSRLKMLQSVTLSDFQGTWNSRRAISHRPLRAQENFKNCPGAAGD